MIDEEDDDDDDDYDDDDDDDDDDDGDGLNASKHRLTDQRNVATCFCHRFDCEIGKGRAACSGAFRWRGRTGSSVCLLMEDGYRQYFQWHARAA